MKCAGLGARLGDWGKWAVCGCVYRSVFRTCYEGWKHSREVPIHTCTWVKLAKIQRYAWSRPGQEYRADFELLAARVLDKSHLAVFRLHFIQGGGWKACCKLLRMDRGNFFHSVYRVEQTLGRACRELQPYGLYPVDEYFNGVSHTPPQHSNSHLHG